MTLSVIVLGAALLSASSATDPAMCPEALAAAETEDPTDAQLYNAAVCAALDADVGLARTLLRRLIDAHPRSALVPTAAYRLADLERSLARYRPAAEVLEQVTQRYPKDERTPQALLELAFVWKGLGEPERARQTLRRYVKLFGRKDPARAQDAAWAHMELAEDDDERLTLARELIKGFGSRLTLDRRAVAEATLGRILWDRSCTHPGPDGDCMTVRPRVTPACSDQPVERVRVGRRKGKLAAEAQEHFAKVLKIAARKPRPTSKDYRAERARWEAYKDAVGMAMVLSHQPAFETLLSTRPIRLPRDPQSATQELGRRVQAQQRISAQLFKDYASVKSSASPTWVLVAAERTARTADHLERWLALSAPASAEPGSAVCQTLEEHRRSFATIATGAYTYCLEKSTEFQFYVPASRHCERWLTQRTPDAYPPLVELLGAPAPGPTRLHTVGVITDADVAMAVGDQLTASSSDTSPVHHP